MRITDAVALDSAQEAAGQLRFEIEAAFSQGLPNTPMANAIVRVVSGNFLTARPVGIVDGVDFIHSGVVRKVDAVGDPARDRHRRDGAAVAVRLLADRRGVQPDDGRRRDEHGDRAAGRQAAVRHRGAGHPRGPRPTRKSPIDTELALADAETPARRRCRRRWCRPTPAFYLRHCVRACRGGVERSHILPFAIDGALLMEVFTHDGIGTMVVDEKLESLRQADRRRHRRRAAADRAVRARRHAGQARPDRDRARHRRLHGDRARRRDIRLRRALSLSRGARPGKWRR